MRNRCALVASCPGGNQCGINACWSRLAQRESMRVGHVLPRGNQCVLVTSCPEENQCVLVTSCPEGNQCVLVTSCPEGNQCVLVTSCPEGNQCVLVTSCPEGNQCALTASYPEGSQCTWPCFAFYFPRKKSMRVGRVLPFIFQGENHLSFIFSGHDSEFHIHLSTSFTNLT
jgi:hypothetical protein